VKAKEEVDNFYHMGCIGTSAGFASKSVLVDEPVRLVEIADMEEELREEKKKQVENLRGVRVLQGEVITSWELIVSCLYA